MSTRRKQRLPKHLDPLSLLEQPENGSAGLLDKELGLLSQNNSGHLSDDGTAISELSYRTNDAEDTSQDAHVCGKCRREFLELSEFLLHKRTCTGIGPLQQEDSKSDDGELPPTHVTLEALRGTKVAVAQFNTQSSNDAPAPPALQDALVSLRQHQAVQLQLLQQLEAYVQSNVGGQPLAVGLERPDSPKVQPADTTNQEEMDEERATEDPRAATSESDAEDRSKSPNGKPGGPAGPLSVLCAPLPPDAAPEATPNQPNTLELLQKHTEKALQNTMSGGSFLLNGLGAFPDEANGDGKRGEGKDNYFRHRCRFCGKVFGSDSALQIHIRSHTGERPFKCNVCGNRFSTKGNLKVHFQRHKAKYPHVKMNPHPVPEHLDKHFPPLEPPGERFSPPPGQLPLGPLPLLSTAANAPLPLDENARFRLSLGLAAPHSAAKSLLGAGGDPRLASAAPSALRLRPFSSAERSVESAASNSTSTTAAATTTTTTTSTTTNPLAENVLLPANSVSAPGLWQLAKELQKSRDRVFGLAESARSNHDEEEESNTSDRSHDNANREQNLSASPAPSSSLKDLMNAQEPRCKRLPLADEDEKLERMEQPIEKRRRNEQQEMSSSLALVQGQSVSDKSEMSECDDTGISGIVAQSPDGDAIAAGYESWEELMEVATDTESGIQKLVELSAQNGGEPNQCVICQRVLSCRSALQMHYRTHTGERPFRCKLCGRAFTTKGNLKTHMGVHRVKAPLRVMHQCPLCSKQFTNALVLQQHVRSHNNNNNNNNNNTDYTNSTTGQPQDLSCTSSPGQGPSPRATPSPQRQSPPITPSSRASLEKPDFPGSRSPGASELAMNDEASRSSPDIRPEVTFREGETEPEPSLLARLNYSPPSHPAVVVPEVLANFIPDLTASRRKATIEALRRNSLNPSEKTDTGSAEGQDGRPENRENGFSKSPLAMPLLLSGGTSLAALESLTNGAQGLGGIALGLMDGRGNVGNNVASDRRRSSPKQEPVLDLSSKPLSKLKTADPTDAAALAVTNLLQTIHNQVKPPTQAELLAQGKLLPGLRFPVASPNGRPNTTCQICYKTFACNSALEIHYRSHTKERPFKCAICERGFSTKGNLKQHMLTHKIRDLPPQLFTQTNISPGAMPNPNAKLGSAAPQALHVPLLPTSPVSGAGENSSDSSRGTSPSTQSPLGSTSSTSTSKHVCTYCQRPFSSSSSLQIHLRTHTGDKPFRCAVCSRAFTTKGNLKVHMGTHVWNQQQSQQLALLAPSNQPQPPPKTNNKRGKKLDTIDPNQVMTSRPDLYYNPYLSASFLNAAAASGGLPLLGGHEHDSPLSLVNKSGLLPEAMSSPLSLVKHLQQQMQYPLANNLHQLHIGASLDNDDSLRREVPASPESGLSSKFEPDPEALSLVKKAGSTMQDINDNNERQKEQILSAIEVKQEVEEQMASAEVAQ